MPRSQASPGGAFPPEPPLSPSVSPASADRGRKKSGSGHRRRGSWSLERPRAHSFDEAEATKAQARPGTVLQPWPAQQPACR